MIKVKIKRYDYFRDGLKLEALEVELKNTTLLLLEGYDMFFMCGALDTAVYKDREVVCGKAVKVKTIEELYEAQIYDLSNYAKSLGLNTGMKVYEAFIQISKKE